jgi:hypothetical protein
MSYRVETLMASNETEGGEMRIIIAGNPVTGFTFYGPFDGALDEELVERLNALDDPWWAVPLEWPELIPKP